MESERDKSFSQSTLQQSAQKRLTNNDATIMQREREINDIAKGIIELADIFKDLSSMVIDQGTMLDRIDYNVERMAVDVKAADKELTVVSSSCFESIRNNIDSLCQATGYQRKSTKRKIILFLLLVVIGMFILLLVKPKRSRNASPPSTAPGAPFQQRSFGGTELFLDKTTLWDPGDTPRLARMDWRRRKRR